MMGRNAAWVALALIGIVPLATGCGSAQVEIDLPDDDQRPGIQTRLGTQDDVESLILPPVVLDIVVYVPQSGGLPELTVVPNPQATLPRLGRFVKPGLVLATAGTYVGVTDMGGEFVFLMRAGDGRWQVSEGRTDQPSDPPETFAGFGTQEKAGRLISTRVPFVFGGTLSVFATGPDFSGVDRVEELVVQVPFGPDRLPRRGVRYRVTP